MVRIFSSPLPTTAFHSGRIRSHRSCHQIRLAWSRVGAAANSRGGNPCHVLRNKHSTSFRLAISVFPLRRAAGTTLNRDGSAHSRSCSACGRSGVHRRVQAWLGVVGMGVDVGRQ